MNWVDWYTDTVDVFRNVSRIDGRITRQTRTQVLSGVPCRLYESRDRAINMTQTAANLRQESCLACDLSTDIQAGDELFIHRGGALGKPGSEIRAFAGESNLYFEPFGAVVPGLAHQEILLLQQERVGLNGVHDPAEDGGAAQTGRPAAEGADADCENCDHAGG